MDRLLLELPTVPESSCDNGKLATLYDTLYEIQKITAISDSEAEWAVCLFIEINMVSLVSFFT